MNRSSAQILLLLCLTAVPVSAQTVSDVVRRHVDARGGAARMRALRSLRLSGTLELPGLAPAPIVLELARPARMRTEIAVGDRKAVRAFDGQVAWERPPVPGEAARRMSAEDAVEARAQADVEMSPLVDAVAKGYAVELVGRDRLLAGDTWKLVVRRDGEPARTLHVHARSYLVVRVEERRMVEGTERDFVTDLADYRSVRGLALPHRIEVGPKGASERQTIVFHSVEIDPTLAPERFSPPPEVDVGRAEGSPVLP